MSKTPSLSKLLKAKKWEQYQLSDPDEKQLKKLQLRLLRIQQGIWHSKGRVIIVFEGFDAAGKGGAIHRLLETLDPRGYQAHPIGPPDPIDQAKHYLYRFWIKLPAPGTIAIFDRSWYERLLVERVKQLTPKKRWRESFDEINQFESILQADGIEIIKIFLAIDQTEQLRRFEDRLKDPYKQWKLTDADVNDSKLWNQYVKATDALFQKTHSRSSPWHLIPANNKTYARVETLKIVTNQLKHHHEWTKKNVSEMDIRSVKKTLRGLYAKIE